MSDLMVFKNDSFGSVRTIQINGEPYFIGKDVAEILGYGNTRDALATHVDKEDKAVIQKSEITTLEIPNRGLTVINESGLYSLIISSKLPSAKRFKHWVTSEVLPTIRKTGGYHLPQTYSEALRELADKAEEVERLSLENKEMKPKADFYDAVSDSKDAIEMKDVAKVLNYPGMGRNKLFSFLREEGILAKDNRPYQEYMDRGYFRVVEQHYSRNDEEVGIYIKTLVYQKGLDYIRKKLEQNMASVQLTLF